MSFADLGLHAHLVRGVENLNFKNPTPIQREAIPPALQGSDVLACSMTGSGKTAAFGLPILHRLAGKDRGTTRALVLTPTRELAHQIVDHIAELAKFTNLKCGAVYGGVSMGPQRRAFESGADIIVATPGRLMDHMQYGYAKLRGIEILVLDEADRMLDMGFLPDIQRILQTLPRERQTLFFSATLPKQIVDLSNQMLKSPVRLNIERQGKPATTITQTAFTVSQDMKSRLCLDMVRKPEMRSVLVFTRTKRRADRLAQFLAGQGVACQRIHGDRTQAQRMQALALFKKGRYRVLVATDVAARGIDIDSLSHVVNFDVPEQAEDYIHRVGRTGRAEALGDAYTFVSREEEGDFRAIERAVGKKITRIQPELANLPAAAKVEVQVAFDSENIGIQDERAYEKTSYAQHLLGQRRNNRRPNNSNGPRQFSRDSYRSNRNDRHARHGSHQGDSRNENARPHSHSAQSTEASQSNQSGQTSESSNSYSHRSKRPFRRQENSRGGSQGGYQGGNSYQGNNSNQGSTEGGAGAGAQAPYWKRFAKAKKEKAYAGRERRSF